MVRKGFEYILGWSDGDIVQGSGFNLTVKDMLEAPNGELVLGVGKFNTVVIPPNERVPTGEVQLNPVFLSALGVKNKETLRKLSLGMENSNALGSILRMRGIEVIEEEEHLWFSSPEYTREIKMGRLFAQFSKAERNFFPLITSLWILGFSHLHKLFERIAYYLMTITKCLIGSSILQT